MNQSQHACRSAPPISPPIRDPLRCLPGQRLKPPARPDVENRGRKSSGRGVTPVDSARSDSALRGGWG
jgi:hypothetical protein